MMASEASQSICDISDLEARLSDPTAGVVDTMHRLSGDLLILGIGGKMGPTLGRMAKRASDLAGIKRGILGVSRFSTDGLERELQAQGIETAACDLLDPEALDRLPDAPNVVYMAGMKFGATGNEARTWAMNAHLPGLVAQRFRDSKIVAFSTGNVYPLVPIVRGGSTEDDTVQPVGEYAMSCLGRERIFEHYSRTLQIPMAFLRLSYAVEMRYGVLADIAMQVLNDRSIDLTMGSLVAIWQGDANAMALQAFDHVATPPCVLNITGPEVLSIRQVAEEFGRVLGRTVKFTGEESGHALISSARKAHGLFGYPRVPIAQVIQWTADWVARGGESLGKPTHFETTDGKF
jgi:nucleoside-diphosphate-sugar epimerase